MEEDTNRGVWFWIKLAGISFSVALAVGSVMYFVCSEYMAQALWEKASEISRKGMIPDPSTAVTDDSNRNAFHTSAIAVADRILVTSGWSITFGLAVFLLLVVWTRSATHQQTFADRIESLALDFVALADEINKSKPAQTKTDWNHERSVLQGQVAAYKGRSLKDLQELERRFPRQARVISEIRPLVISNLDAMTDELAHNHNSSSEQREQLRETATYAYTLSAELKRKIR